MKLPVSISPEAFLASLPDDKRKVLEALREQILSREPHLTQEVKGNRDEPTMIIFKDGDEHRYAISAQKSRMSIHAIPMYGHPPIKEAFEGQWPKAKFQKGCVNFSKPEHIDLHWSAQFFDACGKISTAQLKAIREAHKSK